MIDSRHSTSLCCGSGTAVGMLGGSFVCYPQPGGLLGGLVSLLGGGNDFPSPPPQLDTQAQDLVSIKI